MTVADANQLNDVMTVPLCRARLILQSVDTCVFLGSTLAVVGEPESNEWRIEWIHKREKTTGRCLGGGS